MPPGPMSACVTTPGELSRKVVRLRQNAQPPARMVSLAPDPPAKDSESYVSWRRTPRRRLLPLGKTATNIASFDRYELRHGHCMDRRFIGCRYRFVCGETRRALGSGTRASRGSAGDPAGTGHTTGTTLVAGGRLHTRPRQLDGGDPGAKDREFRRGQNRYRAKRWRSAKTAIANKNGTHHRRAHRASHATIVWRELQPRENALAGDRRALLVDGDG